MSGIVIETERLILRPLRSGDAARFLQLAGDWDVAKMTSDIPHPLTPAQANDWLRGGGGDVRFAIEHGGAMIGGVGYFQTRAGWAELGFWLGRDYWGYGFGTEASKPVIRHGLEAGQKGFSSAHFVDNRASGNLLRKLGFESVGEMSMWCAARGAEVAAIRLWLSPERARELVGPVEPATVASTRSFWPARLGRWLSAHHR
ncbi:MAG: GNAT family N-acetyltransferase [Hyphomicrobiaceae bacterium]